MKTSDDRSLLIHDHLFLSGFDVSEIRKSSRFQYYFFSRGHGSLTPSHANEAMEFRPEENVDAHSCTCFVETFDKLLYYGVSDAFPFHFRSGFDAYPIHFDQVSIHVRFTLDQVSRHVRFLSKRDSHDLYFDELPFGLHRTMLKISLLC